jgi:hypothetical protein
MKWFVLTVFACSVIGHAQSKLKPCSDSIMDMELVLHESAINQVLKGLGEIQGTQTYTYVLLKGSYTWTVSSMAIHVCADSTYFTAQAKVHIAGLNYETPITGRMALQFNSKRNKIQLQLQHAPFPIRTVLFGATITLKTIELADYIKDPFEFDGPLNLKTAWQTEMPDGTLKIIKMSTCACNVFAELHRVRVTCGLSIHVLHAKKTKK